MTRILDGYLMIGLLNHELGEGIAKKANQIFQQHQGIVPLETLARELNGRFLHQTFSILEGDDPRVERLKGIGIPLYRVKDNYVYKSFIPLTSKDFLNPN